MKTRALLIIDLQKGVETPEHKLFQLDRVLQQVNDRIAVFRQNKRPIVFIQHQDADLVPDSDSWQLFPQLSALPSDYYVGKTHANSFYHTALSDLLKELEVTELEICGAQTQYCVDTTIRMAHGLGYGLSMQRGLTTTLDNGRLSAEDIIIHHEGIWDNRFLTFFEE